MANLKYDKEIAALLVIDPYNDFISGRAGVEARGGIEPPKRVLQTLALPLGRRAPCYSFWPTLRLTSALRMIA